MSIAWKKAICSGAILLAILVMAVSCSGGGTSTPHFNDTSGTPGLQGNVTTNPGTPGTGDVLKGSSPQGAYPGAPLGSNPAYETTPVSQMITTTKVSDGTSSARSTSSEEDDPILWVAVARHGETPIPGTDSPPIYEGDKIDLYIRYQVFADQLTVSREWKIDAMGLDYIEPAVSHDSAGTYEAVFPFILAYGIAGSTATFEGVIGPPKSSSIFVVLPGPRTVDFDIVDLPLQDPIYYPATSPDDLNDTDIHGKGCLPENITVEWDDTYGYHTQIYVSCDKILSNLVIKYSDGSTQKIDLGGAGLYEGTWPPDPEKEIVGVWVHSGCNDSGDGPAYGEYFSGYDITQQNKMAMAQFAWDDDSSPDHDYNDFVGRLDIAESRTAEGGPWPADSLVQISLNAKALARGSSNVADWQFNVGASFPNAEDVWVMVNRFHADGSEAYYQEVLHSVGGASFAVFSPTAAAFPGTEGWNTVNCEAGSTYVDGDYAEVLIMVWPPQTQGSYTPMPYDPELAVTYETGGDPTYIPLWSTPADFDDGDPNTTLYPPAFIVPDTFAWVYEEETIENVYPEFTDWINWMNDQSLTEPSPPWWQYDPVKGTHFFYRQDFN